MAKVILSLNGNPQGEFVLRKERITIGRKPENDILINNLAISGYHAVLTTRFGDTVIEDLGSTNGTYINGELVTKQLLQADDVIRLGKHELTFLDDVQKHQKHQKHQKTKSADLNPLETADVQIDESLIDPQAQTAEMGDSQGMQTAQMVQGKIHVLNGPIAGKELPLNQALVTLGKPGIQVAVISKRPQGYFLTHIEGSKDGQPLYPLVNGESIGAKAYTLGNHDIIELAGIKMEFSTEV